MAVSESKATCGTAELGPFIFSSCIGITLGLLFFCAVTRIIPVDDVTQILFFFIGQIKNESPHFLENVKNTHVFI